MRTLLLAFAALFACANSASAQPANRGVFLDDAGVIRWNDTREEVALFGANYCVMSGGDYRMAGLIGADRRAMIDEDVAQFARMGWDAIRLCTWGDWENADEEGNLIANDHLDLMDYLIARASERGIYMLLTPTHTYNANWPDNLENSDASPGFSRRYERGELGLNPAAISAQVNYIAQLLNHVNPHTGRALKDEPAILFVEMINEPVHHPSQHQASVDYINTLNRAVRDTGAQQITFHNVSQDFRIARAIQESEVQGVSFGWYPSGLVAGRTLDGNFLQAVDAYPDMLRPEIVNMPRIVYEFDQADLLTGTMFPAIARTYRSVGTQFATLFAYDEMRTAPYNLGWQTHFVNLVYTPRKAMSAVIAAEVMRRLPGREDYGRYPENLTFGDFHIDPAADTTTLAAADAYMNAGDTEIAAPNPRALTRIGGYGSSPLIDYEGEGTYFLDKVRDGVWRLEIYPDALIVAEPYAQPQPDRVVSQLNFRPWPMHIRLADLGQSFTATPLNVPENSEVAPQRARRGVFTAEPGVWLLSRGAVDRASLPATISRVGFNEFHIAPASEFPPTILSNAPEEFAAGAAARFSARVISRAPPEEVQLYIRAAGAGGFNAPVAMARTRGYDFAASVPDLAPGLYEYVVTARTAEGETTFPGAAQGRPGQWPFAAADVWRFRVVDFTAPVVLFDAARDYGDLSFVRPEEQYRGSFYSIVPAEGANQAALALSVPDLGADTPARYAGALYVGDAIEARDVSNAAALAVRVRAIGGARKTVNLILVEEDGSSWSGAFAASGDWQTLRLPLSQLQFTRSIHIPSPFPGLWNYWREGPAARAGGQIRPAGIERLELRVNRNEGETAGDTGAGVEIQSIWLEY